MVSHIISYAREGFILTNLKYRPHEESENMVGTIIFLFKCSICILVGKLFTENMSLFKHLGMKYPILFLSVYMLSMRLILQAYAQHTHEAYAESVEKILHVG